MTENKVFIADDSFSTAGEGSQTDIRCIRCNHNLSETGFWRDCALYEFIAFLRPLVFLLINLILLLFINEMTANKRNKTNVIAKYVIEYISGVSIAPVFILVM